MKVSIITACLNSAHTIEDTIKSVLEQDHKDIEYIVIDGGSADGTLDILKKYQSQIQKCISEPDRGIYDALNKGLKFATAEIVGFLHADDFYATKDVIKKIVNVFNNNKVDCLWGDLLYVNKENPKATIRYWKSSHYKDNLFKSHVTSKNGHDGLGLPIVMDIVTHLDGILRVESTAGRGTCFHIELPAGKVSAVSTRKAAPKP